MYVTMASDYAANTGVHICLLIAAGAQWMPGLSSWHADILYYTVRCLDQALMEKLYRELKTLVAAMPHVRIVAALAEVGRAGSLGHKILAVGSGIRAQHAYLSCTTLCCSQAFTPCWGLAHGHMVTWLT